MSNYAYAENLETERLRTRKLTAGDVDDWVSFCSDEESIEFFPSLKLTTPQVAAEQWIQKQLGRYAEGRYGLQALIHKDTGDFIGQCGLLTQEVVGRIELEVGYHIFKKFRGFGYAPEAARLFIEYAFQANQAPSVISIIDVKNIKSQRVAEKNKLTREKQVRWNDLDVFIYRINRNVMVF